MDIDYFICLFSNHALVSPFHEIRGAFARYIRNLLHRIKEVIAHFIATQNSILLHAQIQEVRIAIATVSVCVDLHSSVTRISNTNPNPNPNPFSTSLPSSPTLLHILNAQTCKILIMRSALSALSLAESARIRRRCRSSTLKFIIAILIDKYVGRWFSGPLRVR